MDSGLETLALKLPAVITTDLRLNEPRYATLPAIMKAKRKPLEIIGEGELEVDTSKRLEYLNFAEPAARSAGVMVDSAAELVNRLKNEAKVI